MRKSCSLSWASSFRSLDNAPLEFRIQHFPAAASSGKAQRKLQGIASELLRRSALGWKTAFPPDRASAQPGITKTVRALAFSWIFFRRRPARLFSRNFDRPKNFVLLTSRNGNHAAGFVGDECDDPIERGGAHLYAAEQW
jgi:hypothetical protein